jgi:hypothetical protein
MKVCMFVIAPEYNVIEIGFYENKCSHLLFKEAEIKIQKFVITLEFCMSGELCLFINGRTKTEGV